MPVANRRIGQHADQFGRSLVGDRDWLRDRLVLVRDPPDAAVLVVTVRVANRVLHMPDERVVPVDNVQRGVRSEDQIDRAERGIVRLHQRLSRHALEARRSVRGRLHARRLTMTADLDVSLPLRFLDLRLRHELVVQHTEEPDAVFEQEVALPALREVRRRDDFAASRRSPLLLQDRRHAGVLIPVLHIAGVRSGVVVVTVRGVGYEVLPPLVEAVPPRVREPIRNVDVEPVRDRIEAEDRRILHPFRAVRRFDLRVMEHALLEVQLAGRTPLKRRERVVGVGGIEPVQDSLRDVGLVVAVGVGEIHQIRLAGDVAGVASGVRDARRQMQAIGEDGFLVGLAVAVGVFVDQDLVVNRRTGQIHRVGRHRDHPHAAAFVERELHRVFERREVLLGCKQVHLEPVGQFHFLERRFRVDDRRRVRRVRFDRRELAGAFVVNRRNFVALRRGPHPRVAAGDHVAKLLELGREVDDTKRRFALSVDVAAVDGPVVVPKLQVLLCDSRPECVGVVGGRGLFGVHRTRPEQRHVEHRSEADVAAFG